MDYRQISFCEFGTKRIIVRQHIDLAEPLFDEQISTPNWRQGMNE